MGTQTKMRAKSNLSDFCHPSLGQSAVCRVIVPWEVGRSWVLRPSPQTQPLGEGLGTQGLLCALLSDPGAAVAGCAREVPPAPTPPRARWAWVPPLRWPG